MVRGSLVYSGIVVSTFLAIIFISWFAIFIFKYHQLQKFKNKGGKVFELSSVYYSAIFLFAVSLVAYLSSMIFGILFLAGNETNEIFGIIFEVMFLIYIVLIFIFLVILLVYQNTIILAFKSETFLTMNTIVDVKSVLQIRRDNKRRWIFINWKDEKNPKRIRELKLKYSYSVKDFLKEIGLWQEQEPIK